jgi:hypothetical protein
MSNEPIDNRVVFLAVRLLRDGLGGLVLVGGQVDVRQLTKRVQAAQQVKRSLTV